MSWDDGTKVCNLLILGIDLRNLDGGFNRFNKHRILPRAQILDGNRENEIDEVPAGNHDCAGF
jgi:hypothetical protein